MENTWILKPFDAPWKVVLSGACLCWACPFFFIVQAVSYKLLILRHPTPKDRSGSSYRIRDPH